MFKLDFEIPESKVKINLKDPILLMGSCFSDEVGSLLAENKFLSLSNPFGTIYNPHSIFKLISGQSTSNNIIESQGVFYHWDTHGVISGLSEAETKEQFKRRQTETLDFLKKTKWLILTPGTSIVYEYQSKQIVANCHKIPSSQFEKRFLNQEEIVKEYASLHSYLQSINPKLKIIFTVSPVRHIRDGLMENNRSKAILINAIHSIINKFQNTCYFPSYEIVMDELRDYRFFKTDRVHPSEEAIEYVWKKFGETFFDEETNHVLSDWSKLKAALGHRPFQARSISHQKFLKNTLSKLEVLNEKINLSVEISKLQKQLS